MSKQSLFVFACITPKPEHFEEALSTVESIVDQTLAEAGCKQFSVYQALDHSRFHLFEEWVTQEALDSHYEQPYIKAIFAKYENWLSCPPEIMKMNAVG
ncbi:putative quinol monooxygenase [Acaryochloris marina NIES-2412]|uniref:putative quinol monooxygenase n=1 Tax=Acaryochloris marina TaxID=155978 RepID=UPI004059BF0A